MNQLEMKFDRTIMKKVFLDNSYILKIFFSIDNNDRFAFKDFDKIYHIEFELEFCH